MSRREERRGWRRRKAMRDAVGEAAGEAAGPSTSGDVPNGGAAESKAEGEEWLTKLVKTKAALAVANDEIAALHAQLKEKDFGDGPWGQSSVEAGACMLIAVKCGGVLVLEDGGRPKSSQLSAR